jgi:hypothetical protein
MVVGLEFYSWSMLVGQEQAQALCALVVPTSSCMHALLPALHCLSSFSSSPSS